MEVRGPGGQHLRNDDAFPGTPSTRWSTSAAASRRDLGDADQHRRARAGGRLHLRVHRAAARGRRGTRSARGRPPRRSASRPSPGCPGAGCTSRARRGLDRPPASDLAAPSTPSPRCRARAGRRGSTTTRNDLGADGHERALDSTVVAALPQSGVYQLVVTAYGEAGGARSRCAAQARAPVAARPGGRATGGARGPGRRRSGARPLRRHHRLPSNAGELYGCADDARLLGRGDARQRTCRARPTSSCCRTGSRRARRSSTASRRSPARRGRRTWCWSSSRGHGAAGAGRGGRRRARRARRDDLLLDGPVTDDEVVAALDAIRAGTVILALDSCHSGGFADDWVPRAGPRGPLLERRGRPERHRRAAPRRRLPLVVPAPRGARRGGRAPARRGAGTRASSPTTSTTASWRTTPR